MQKSVLPLIVALFIVLAGSSWYFYDQTQKLQAEVKGLKTNPSKIAQQEAETLISKVGKLIALPKDEKPTIATIADKSKIDLKQQPFFTNAENGDRILLYVKAKKAIMYREKTNKIIEVGTLNVQQQPQQKTPTRQPTATQ